MYLVIVLSELNGVVLLVNCVRKIVGFFMVCVFLLEVDVFID